MMDRAGDLGSVLIGDCDWTVVTVLGGGKWAITRGNVGSLFCKFLSHLQKTPQKAILILNLGFLVENLPPTVI